MLARTASTVSRTQRGVARLSSRSHAERQCH